MGVFVKVLIVLRFYRD